jgi:hypothetical protein
MNAIYTTDQAKKDGYDVRPNVGTFLDVDGDSFAQFEFGRTDEEGEFQTEGFCYEA